jgi:hypothetical protein
MGAAYLMRGCNDCQWVEGQSTPKREKVARKAPKSAEAEESSEERE